MTEYRDTEHTESGESKEAETTVLYQNNGAKDGMLGEAQPNSLKPRGDKHFSYADYCSWDDDERWELIDGVAYAMSAPLVTHQRILRELFMPFGSFLRGKPCEVFVSPFDVRLGADEADDTVVQPDLLVVCDRTKLDDKGYKGTPDLIIEILSPTTAGYDRLTKFNRYLRAGVKEYWMVDPDGRTVQVCLLRDDQYFTKAYGEGDTVPVDVLPGLEISLPDVFAEMQL